MSTVVTVKQLSGRGRGSIYIYIVWNEKFVHFLHVVRLVVWCSLSVCVFWINLKESFLILTFDKFCCTFWNLITQTHTSSNARSHSFNFARLFSTLTLTLYEWVLHCSQFSCIANAKTIRFSVKCLGFSFFISFVQQRLSIYHEQLAFIFYDEIQYIHPMSHEPSAI